MIISEVHKQWPEDQDTPIFGKGSGEGGKLAVLICGLSGK